MPMPPLSARTISSVIDAFQVALKAWMDAYTFENDATLEWAYDNLSFDPEAAFSSSVPKGEQAWVRVRFSHTAGLSGTAALGDNLFRRYGIIRAEIFVRENTGRALVDEIADRVLLFFETQALPGMSFEGQSPVEVGPSDGWYEVDVQTEFKYDTLRNAS